MKYKRTKFNNKKRNTKQQSSTALVPSNGNGHNGNGNTKFSDMNSVQEFMAEQKKQINEAIIKQETENEDERPRLMRLDEKYLNDIKDEKKRRFLLKLSERAIMTEAQIHAGVSSATPYNWLNSDPVFKAAFDRAKKVACDNIEREIWRRGNHGIKSPVYHQGRLCGFKREYSDTLLIFNAKGLMPEKYKESISMNNFNGPVEVRVSFSDEAIASQRKAGFVIDTTAEEVQ